MGCCHEAAGGHVRVEHHAATTSLMAGLSEDDALTGNPVLDDVGCPKNGCYRMALCVLHARHARPPHGRPSSAQTRILRYLVRPSPYVDRRIGPCAVGGLACRSV